MAVPQVDFSPLADLGQVYQQAKQRATREQVLGQLAQGSGPLDYNVAAKSLLSAGDTEGFMSLAKLAQQQYLTSPEYITKAKTAEAQVAEQFAPKTVDITAPGGEKVTVQKGPGGYTIPQIQGMPTQTAVPVPPGADPKKYREGIAAAHVANQEATVKDAKAAADFQPIVDQAVAAYERAHAAGAIGPIAGSAPMRANEKYNPLAPYIVSPEKEKARQDYDKALAALQARITAAQNKGEGAVSNFERQMYAAQFPDLTSVEPTKGLEYLRQIQAQTKQTAAAGQTTPLGTTPNVSAVMQRPSIPNMTGQPSAPQAAPAQASAPQAAPNAWRTKENITAARSNPQQTIAEAQKAVANGMPAQEAIRRLRESGIPVDPSMFGGGAPAPAGAAGAIY